MRVQIIITIKNKESIIKPIIKISLKVHEIYANMLALRPPNECGAASLMYFALPKVVLFESCDSVRGKGDAVVW